jgi:hypothetical protein
LQQAKARELMAFRKEEEGTAALAVPTIDTHLHVWASPEESKKYPYFPGQEPTIPGSAEDLLKVRPYKHSCCILTVAFKC